MRLPVRLMVLICSLSMLYDNLAADTVIIGNNFQQAIPAQGDGLAWMDPVQLSVDQHMTITDIDVYLDITHREVSELKILIDSPCGKTVVLKDLWPTPWRDPHSNMHSTIFDDEAEIELSSGQPPYKNRYRPTKGESLSLFDGCDAYGQWQLRIKDDALGDIGTLDKWELYITHTPEPGILLLTALGGIVLARKRNHRQLTR